MTGLKQEAWVLVCDGRKALLLHNKGDAVYPKLETLAEFEHDDPPSKDLGSDSPGRTFSSAGGRRSAIEPVDLHELAEERFLTKVAERVNRDAGEKHFRSLVVVAPPRALAVLRRELSHQTRAVIAAEFDKDLVKEPVHALENHIQRLLSEKA